MTSDEHTVRPRDGTGHTPRPDDAFEARFARDGDADELVRLRSAMFESMGIDTSQADWQDRCRVHLGERLAQGTLIGAVVDRPGGSGLAASALAELSTRLPSPSWPTATVANLSSVSTDPDCRRRGMARGVVSLLLGELVRRGVHRVELHATEVGEPLYRSLGFLPRAGGKEIRLVL